MTTKVTLTRELLEDWFKGIRDPKTFVAVSPEVRSDWEETLSGDALSEFFIENDYELRTKSEVVRKTFHIARNMILSMGIGRRFTLDFEKDASYTDGQTIVLATAPLDDTDLKVLHRIDVVLGLGIHEGAHLKHTDFKRLRQKASSTPAAEFSVKKQINNIIEDERIETLVSQDAPGHGRFLEKTKKYYFHTLYKRELEAYEASGITTKEDVAKEILDLFLKFIRYPEAMDVEKVEKHFEALCEIRDVVTPIAKTDLDAWEQTDAVYDILCDKYEEEMKEKRKEVDKAISDLKDKMKELSELAEALGEALSKALKEEAEKGNGDTSKSDALSEEKIDKDAEAEKIEELIKELKASKKELKGDFNEAAKGVLKAIKVVTSKGSDTHEASMAEMSKVFDTDDDLRDEIETKFAYKHEKGTAEVGSNTYFLKSHPNRVTYAKDRAEVSRIASALGRTLTFRTRDRKIVLKGVRNGILDTGKLVEAKQGIDNVYEAHGQVLSEKIAVVLLIDESGSMGGKNIAAARKTAILFNEALKNNKDVELFIYGHTADQYKYASTDLRIYKEVGTKTDPYALGGVVARSQNRDGVAIHEVAARVRTRTKRPMVMFVLADGAPCADRYYGSSSIIHTRDMVNLIEKKLNCTTIHIAIDTHVPSEQMFKNYVTFTDLASLPKDLGGLMKSVVKKMVKIETTY